MTANFALESWIQWSPLILGAITTVVAMLLSRKIKRAGYMIVFQQSIVFFAALIMIVSVFVPPLFVMVQHSPIFIGVIAMMTLIYAARDIVGNLRR